MKRPRVLLADDHQVLAEGLRSLLQDALQRRGHRVGRAGSRRRRETARSRCRGARYLDAVPQWDRRGPPAAKGARCRAKVVCLTMHGEVTYAARILEAGASGFVLKHSAASELVTAIQEVLKGGTYITPRIAADLLDSFRQGVRADAEPQGELLAPAGSPPARRRRPLGQGNRLHTAYLDAHGRVPQGPAHGYPGPAKYGRAGAVRHPHRHLHRLTGAAKRSPTPVVLRVAISRPPDYKFNRRDTLWVSIRRPYGLTLSARRFPRGWGYVRHERREQGPATVIIAAGGCHPGPGCCEVFRGIGQVFFQENALTGACFVAGHRLELAADGARRGRRLGDRHGDGPGAQVRRVGGRSPGSTASTPPWSGSPRSSSSGRARRASSC